WQGFVPGMLGGMIIGSLIGATGWIYHPETDGNEPKQFDQNFAITTGALVGILIGPFIGYAIGYGINFVFDQ
ncbi:MAG TPA: hypothetical protein VLB50_10610, partial [Ignavibacteriaceae bacterium]|nr:hypothetical protein [Ignavibacteriaceae bacterium]